MINGIGIAKSDRSKCSFCNKKIGKGVPRGYATQEKYYGSEKYYCFNCSFNLMRGEIARIKKLMNDLNQMIEENKDIITKNEIIENLKEE